jgi:hypothetical protein
MPWGDFAHWSALSFVAGIVMGLALFVSGCANAKPAVVATNTVHHTGVEMCTLPVQQAKTQAEIDRVNRAGCPEAARAHRAVRESKDAVVAVLLAMEAGRCTSLVNQAPLECGIGKAMDRLLGAVSAAARARKAVEDALR